MKKKIVRSLLLVLTLFLIALTALAAYVLQDEPLRPTAEQALHYQPSPVPPERNAYVGFAGLEAPAGSDFIQVGVENIRRANQRFQVSAQTAPEENTAQKLAFSTARNTYSCNEEMSENCLEEIEAEAQHIQTLLEENDELIARYLRIQAMPEFSNNSTGSYFAPSYGTALELSWLLSAKAVLDIQNGRLKEGLDFIERDMNFYRSILAAKDIALFDTKMVAVPIRQQANLLARLYQEGRLSGQTDRVRALMKPLEAPDKTFTNALWRERVFAIQRMNARPKTLAEMTDIGTGHTPGASYLDQLKGTLLFKPNMSLNLLDEIFTLETDTINAMTAEALSSQRNVLWKDKIRPRVCTIPKDDLFCRHWKNFVGEMLVTRLYPDHVRPLLRIHDLDARFRLFRAQLEFVEAAKNAPETEAPEVILARLGPETFNPYTGQPFEWDPETASIGFMPAADKPSEWVSVRLFPQ
jgi:hypothetical protein